MPEVNGTRTLRQNENEKGSGPQGRDVDCLQGFRSVDGRRDLSRTKVPDGGSRSVRTVVLGDSGERPEGVGVANGPTDDQRIVA